MKRVILALFIFIAASSTLFAEESKPKALLISIERYALEPLAFARQDIDKLAGVLMTRYGCATEACVNKGKNVKIGNLPKHSVMAAIESWCEQLSAADTALLYLAGHGVKDGNGKLYLVMIDFNGKNFETAAIPMEWIRGQYGKCEAKSKLLLLDTCFAGTSKGYVLEPTAGGGEMATSGEISGEFADLSGVATIASSREDERSWLWMEEKHSLFTYWLIEAFKGHADQDGDRVLTFGELIRYLKTNVSEAADIALEESQHPVALNEAAGNGFRMPLRGVALADLIDDIAEQIDLQMRMNGYTQIGVPAFTSGETKTFDPAHGALPRQVSKDLQDMLRRKSRKSGYTVMNENALHEMLASNGIRPEDLGGKKTKGAVIEGKEISVLVDGRMTIFRESGVATLHTNLLDTRRNSLIGRAGGVAWLSDTEIGQTGVSGANLPGSVRNNGNESYVWVEGIGYVSTTRIQEVNRIRDAQKKRHPMADASMPFKVWFEVRPINRPNSRYVKRDVKIDGNNCYLPLSRGEEYRIMIQNNSKNLVFARILVDGLNTISQKENTWEEGTVAGMPTLAPRVNLNDAKPWVLKPWERYCIEGFYDANSEKDTLHRFQIVDADKSVAAQKSYTKQIGLITIGFFESEKVPVIAPPAVMAAPTVIAPPTVMVAPTVMATPTPTVMAAPAAEVDDEDDYYEDYEAVMAVEEDDAVEDAAAEVDDEDDDYEDYISEDYIMATPEGAVAEIDDEDDEDEDYEAAMPAPKVVAGVVNNVAIATNEEDDAVEDAAVDFTKISTIGTGKGRAESSYISRYKGDVTPGKMLSVYNIRYMTPESLKKITK